MCNNCCKKGKSSISKFQKWSDYLKEIEIDMKGLPSFLRQYKQSRKGNVVRQPYVTSFMADLQIQRGCSSFERMHWACNPCVCSMERIRFYHFQFVSKRRNSNAQFVFTQLFNCNKMFFGSKRSTSLLLSLTHSLTFKHTHTHTHTHKETHHGFS